ncbi:hypothetical protein BKA56DRAFT_592894 [Ilyonectria sp. MPI-CAGE-AT-0026]|nr:hypothetical protein BKA56DRAFT_592894 [Ilyonectria sp. MPI-CAGE-AT-0026]
MLNSPKPSFLQTLIRINALNAIVQNAKKIGIPVDALCRDEAISPFSQTGPLLPAPTAPLPSCPEVLHPTQLQKTVFHHPWIDVLPLLQLRDNLLKPLSVEGFDEDERCLEVFHPADHFPMEEQLALIIWGDGDNIRCWEASIAFLRKWGWLLRGCPELLESTNAWRMQRGEKTLKLSK